MSLTPLPVRTHVGTDVLLRPIDEDDTAALADGFEHLSEDARRNRFFTARQHLEPGEAERFTAVDHRDHAAWGVIIGDRPVAVGRSIRLSNDPTTAEVAFTVADAFQGQGIGSLLLRVLAPVARANGIERFVAYVRVGNDPMIAVLRHAGGVVAVEEPGVLRIELALPLPPSTSLPRTSADAGVDGATDDQLVELAAAAAAAHDARTTSTSAERGPE